MAERLPTPKGHGPKSAVTGGDPSGRYVLGRSYPGGGRDRLLIWEDGREKIRHVVPIEGTDPHLYDINTRGVAVGISFVGPYGKETEVAWIVSDGKAQRLRGENAAAVGINEAGVIVGTVGDRPAVWRTADATPEILPGPKGKWLGGATGVDEDGTIVGGFSGIGNQRNLAYVWSPDGTARELAPAAGADGQKPTGAGAGSIRDGLVLGTSLFEDARTSSSLTTLWDLRTGAVTTRPDVYFADEANARGWAIGRARVGPVLSSAARTVVLPPAKGTRTGGPTEVFELISLSDDGRTIAGYQDAAEGDLVIVRRTAAVDLAHRRRGLAPANATAAGLPGRSRGPISTARPYRPPRRHGSRPDRRPGGGAGRPAGEVCTRPVCRPAAHERARVARSVVPSDGAPPFGW